MNRNPLCACHPVAFAWCPHQKRAPRRLRIITTSRCRRPKLNSAATLVCVSCMIYDQVTPLGTRNLLSASSRVHTVSCQGLRTKSFRRDVSRALRIRPGTSDNLFGERLCKHGADCCFLIGLHSKRRRRCSPDSWTLPADRALASCQLRIHILVALSAWSPRVFYAAWINESCPVSLDFPGL